MDQTLRVARRAFAAAALTSVAALATACGPSSGTAASNNAAPAPSDTTTAATSPAAATSPSAPATTPAAPSGPAPCPTRSLKVKLGASQGAAGSVYTTIVFKNISNATCTLYGYPGVALTTGVPVGQIGKAAKENPATPRKLVTLQPQTTASAVLRIVNAQNYSASQCHPVTAHYLQVYPPNQTARTYIRYHATGCAKPINLMTVDVVKPGSGS